MNRILLVACLFFLLTQVTDVATIGSAISVLVVVGWMARRALRLAAAPLRARR